MADIVEENGKLRHRNVELYNENKVLKIGMKNQKDEIVQLRTENKLLKDDATRYIYQHEADQIGLRDYVCFFGELKADNERLRAALRRIAGSHQCEYGCNINCVGCDWNDAIKFAESALADSEVGNG